MPITLEEIEKRLDDLNRSVGQALSDTPLTWKEKDALIGQLAKIEGQLKEQDERINKLEGRTHGK